MLRRGGDSNSCETEVSRDFQSRAVPGCATSAEKLLE